jgi:hypothetical protein
MNLISNRDSNNNLMYNSIDSGFGYIGSNLSSLNSINNKPAVIKENNEYDMGNL